MKKKIETIKTKQIKQKIIELIENESNNEVKLIESKDTKIGETFSIPIYIDLEGYSTEKLNDIIEENYNDIIEEIINDDYINTLSLVFMNLKEKEINMNFKVSNRDDEDEECINILLEY